MFLCRHAAGNFNNAMCKASKCTIVEVEEIVEPGTIEPINVCFLIQLSIKIFSKRKKMPMFLR